MAVPHRFPAQSNTPAQIATGAVGEVQILTVRNPHATDGAYVKLYEGASAPTGATAPRWTAWVAPGSVSLPCFVTGSRFWIAVALEEGAGLSAPSSPFLISATFEYV